MTFVRFPWEPEKPIRVEVLRSGAEVSHVKTVHPEHGCFAGEWPAKTAWLEPESVECPHCGPLHDRVCRNPDGTVDRTPWSTAQRDEWRDRARRLNPGMRFAPSSANFQARFGKRNREERGS